jgi:hypothetical protein
MEMEFVMLVKLSQTQKDRNKFSTHMLNLDFFKKPLMQKGDCKTEQQEISEMMCELKCLFIDTGHLSRTILACCPLDHSNSHFIEHFHLGVSDRKLDR